MRKIQLGLKTGNNWILDKIDVGIRLSAKRQTKNRDRKRGMGLKNGNEKIILAWKDSRYILWNILRRKDHTVNMNPRRKKI